MSPVAGDPVAGDPVGGDPIGILAGATADGDIDAVYKAHFGRAFRRIGRYVKLALVGAARCVQDLPPDQRRDLGVFLGSGLGNTAKIVPLARGILHADRPRTSPMAFAGCVGNAAAFSVARALQLQGPNVTLSQGALSFEAALLEAVLALQAGDVRLALVGGVDARSGDDSEQRVRIEAQGVPGEVVDGAAFVLLGPVEGARAVLDEVWLGRASQDALLAGCPAGARLLPGWGIDHPDRETRLVPIASGLRLVEAMQAAAPGDTLVHVQRTAGGSAGRVRLRLS